MAAVAASLAAAGVDLRTRRVPNALTLGMAVAGLGAAAAGLGRVGLAASLAGCLIGALLMLPGHVFGATGGGDVKLLAAAGSFLGPASTVTAFLVTAIAGGLIALAVAAHRGRLARTIQATSSLVAGRTRAAEIEDPASDNRFAYAPAIAIGVAVAVLGS